METVIFVHGNPPLGKYRELCGKDTQVVALDVQSSLALDAAKMAHKTADKYPLPDNVKRAVDFLNNWSIKPILDDKTIKDVLVHDGFSFWWCMEQWLYYSFLYRDQMQKIVNAVDVINVVLKIEKPKKAIYFNDGTLFSKVIPLLAGKAQVPLSQISNARPVLPRIKEIIRPWGIKHFLRLHSRARRWVWKFERWRANYRLPEKEGKKILAVCAYHWRTIDHPSLKQPTLGDPYISPIVEQLNDNVITYVDTTQRRYVGFETLKKKSQSKQRHVLLEQYVSRADLRDVRNALKKFKRVERNLENSPEFKKSWMLDGIDLWPLIAPQFRCYFAHRLEGHLLDYVSVKTLINHEKPDVVAFPSEGGDLAYQFFKVCLDNGIPCVAIQHGALDYSPPTVHLPEEMGIGKPQYLPRPTKLLVYGSYYRDFFIQNGGYPQDEIKIVGNFRFDHFANAHKPSKKSMIEKFNLDEKKPIILYAGQVLPSTKEYEETTRAVFNATKELGFTLIVKQHPGEVNDALYHKLAQEMGIKLMVTQTESTTDLLTVCDVLIGYESTLDYEAMILNKPVVVLNFSNQPNTLPFAEEGAAIGVFTPEDVVPAIKKVLFDGDTRAMLSKRMHDLIKAHCYQIDGKAAERTAEIIREMIK